jgi:hypothetical protein
MVLLKTSSRASVWNRAANADARKLRFGKEDSNPPKMLEREQVAEAAYDRIRSVNLPELIQKVFGADPWRYEKYQDQFMIRLAPLLSNKEARQSLIAWLGELKSVRSVDELHKLPVIRKMDEPEQQQETRKRRGLLQDFFDKLGESAALDAKAPEKPLIETVFEKVLSPFMTGDAKRFSQIVFTTGERADCCGVKRYEAARRSGCSGGKRYEDDGPLNPCTCVVVKALQDRLNRKKI